MRKTDIILITAIGGSFWPVWIWYWQRLSDRSDEPLGIIAILTALAILKIKTALPSEKISQNPKSLYKLLPIAFLLAYIFTFPVAPKALSGLLAVCTIYSASTFALNLLPFNLGFASLLLLSLPIVSTLNFYLGYPLRLASAFICSIFLNLSGYNVVVQGTQLLLGTMAVEIDAPCSGVKMLWFSAFIASTLAAATGQTWRRSFLLIAVAELIAFGGNILRLSSLFFLESGTFERTPLNSHHDLIHQGIGLVSFALVALGIFYSSSRICNKSAPAFEEAPKQNISIQTGLNSNSMNWFAMTIILLTLISATMPVFFSGQATQVKLSKNFQFPNQFEGKELKPLPLTASEKRFAEGFPGAFQAFTDGPRTIIIRFIEAPTRQLHSASDCYRGLGFKIDWKPIAVDKDGSRWGVFEASRGNEKLTIRERVVSLASTQTSTPQQTKTQQKSTQVSAAQQQCTQFTDISSWYWAALWGKSEGPWQAITVVSN